MKVNLKTIRSLFLAAGAAGILTSSTAMARDFRSADIHPNDYPTVQGAMYMGKLLSERTGGKMGVKVFPNARWVTNAARSNSCASAGWTCCASAPPWSTTWCRKPS